MSETRFLISYIVNNQPKSMELSAEADTLSPEDVLPYIKALHISEPLTKISDIQVMGIHRPRRPHVPPGHYQQPEG
jgi:hypothetical protein